jgi:hypothetical protein
MTGHTSKILALVAMAGLVAGLTGCCNLFWTSNCPPKIAQQPQSQIVKEGDPVSFSVAVSQPKGLSYQWQFNGTNICGATGETYTLPHRAEFADVGEYRVLVDRVLMDRVSMGGENEITLSKPAFLSIYSFSQVQFNVTAGTLSTPIGQFGNQTYTCDDGTNHGTFQKGYTPVNASGQPMFFYGPKAAPQSGLFTNLGVGSTLTIDTFSSNNGTADTGIRIQNNVIPPTDAGCNDNASGGTYSKQSQCTIALSQIAGGVAQKNTYRLSILYMAPPGAPASGKVTFNWKYE